jgi:CubicO group peptidase (beta-lactamase class C family)
VQQPLVLDGGTRSDPMFAAQVAACPAAHALARQRGSFMPRRSIWYPILAAALLGSAALPSTTFAQSAPQTAYSIPPERLVGLADFVDGVMAQQIATREVAGAVVTVVHQGRVLFTRGYGFADVDQGVAVDPQHSLFRLASVSKLFTWAALMQQVEAGRVSLDADVNDYIDFSIPPFEGRPIRVRDLLAHTPGMSDVGGITARSVDKIIPYGDWLKTHIPQRLWPAGTEAAYSNYGAALAGYIVERVSGEPFADYADHHIFAPLGMESTSFREPLPTALAPRVVRGYRFRDGRFVAKPFELYSPIMPGGSGSASAPDMTRFMMAMLNGGAIGTARILKPESVALLMRDSHANAPDLPGMAHGFFVVRNAGPRIVGHSGNTVDFHSHMILAPEAGLGFFVSETGGPGSYDGRTELTEALIGRLFPQNPAPRTTAPVSEVVPFGAYRGNRRDYSRPANPERDLQIAAAGANAITIKRQKSTTYWERVGPLRFEQVTGARAGGPYEQLHFYGEDGGWRLSFSSQPHVAYHQVHP